jgi:hypothetical protein
MKKYLITILVLAFAGTVLAADLVITVPPNDIPRVQEAFGSILGLGRPANQNEIERATKQWIIGQTQDYERRKNMQSFTPPPLEMQPTPSPTPTAGVLQAAPSVTPKKK